MFQYFPQIKELEILANLLVEIRSSDNPKSVLDKYIENYPQYEQSMTEQYLIDEQEGFVALDEVYKEMQIHIMIHK